MTEDTSPTIGEKRWSPYFGREIILTHYEADDDWYFRFDYNRQTFEAQSPWSEMPLIKEVE